MICLEDVLKMSWRRLEDVLKMSWRRFQDVLKDVFKMSYSQDEYIGLDQDVLKTPWRRLLKTKTKDIFKTSSRRLHQDECLLGVYWRPFVKIFRYSNFHSIAPFFKCIKLHQILSLFSTMNLAYVLETNIFGKDYWNLNNLFQSTFKRFLVENRDNIWYNKKGNVLALNFKKMSFLGYFLVPKESFVS